MAAESPSTRRTHFIGLRVKLWLGFTLLFTVVFAVAFYWFYNFASATALQRIQEDLLTTLKGAAAGVDADQFIALSAEAQPRADGYTDAPQYWEHVKWLTLVHDLEPRAWIYTYVKGAAPGEILFIGSNGAVFTPPVGVKFRESAIVPGASPIWRGLQEMVPKDNFAPYQDQWGKWITAYTPIVNRQGTAVGGLGIDFQADYVYEVQQGIRQRVGIAFAVTYAVLFLMVYLISLTLTRPIIRLTSAAQRIAEGDYQQDVAVGTPRFPDEISALAKVFALMAAKVYQREQTLRRQVAELKIEIDVTKRHQQVSEIVDTDFFQDLQARARVLRQRYGDATQHDADTSQDGQDGIML